MALTLGELAERFGGKVHGDSACAITGVSTLTNAAPCTITFLANPGYREHLLKTSASAVILSSADVDACPVNALVTENPYATYARIAALLAPSTQSKSGIHASAVIDAKSNIHELAWIGPLCVIESGAIIKANTFIGPGCVIGENVVIGENCRLTANVTICKNVHMGDGVMIHPGAVIGSDGFGFAREANEWIKVPQLGTVQIGNDVEIGANTTIDKGALEDTVLEDGVKLDNQIQIAHNVQIGAHTAIAGCVGISGSTKIGKRCMIGGAAGILGHLEIADDVQINAMSLVTKSIDKAGVYSSGMPAMPKSQWAKNLAYFRRATKNSTDTSSD